MLYRYVIGPNNPEMHLGLAVVSPGSSLARKQVKGELGVQDVKVCTISTNP